jgi:hypothetical protein
MVTIVVVVAVWLVLALLVGLTMAPLRRPSPAHPSNPRPRIEHPRNHRPLRRPTPLR